MQSSFGKWGDAGRLQLVLRQINTENYFSSDADACQAMLEYLLPGDHLPSAKLDRLVAEFLGEALRLQRRQHSRQPFKDKSHKRFVTGLKECEKALEIPGQVKLFIIARDNTHKTTLNMVDISSVHRVWALSRELLGFLLYGPKRTVSHVAVINLDGILPLYGQTVTLLEELKLAFLKEIDQKTLYVAHLAARYGHLELWDKNCDEKQLSSAHLRFGGCTPVMLACQYNPHLILSKLKQGKPLFDWEVCDFSLRNCLHYAFLGALYEQNVDLLKVLLKSVTWKEDAAKQDPLMLGLKTYFDRKDGKFLNNESSLLCVLNMFALDEYSRADLNVLGLCEFAINNGTTPAILRKLLDINDKLPNTLIAKILLIRAVQAGNFPCVKYLLAMYNNGTNYLLEYEELGRNAREWAQHLGHEHMLPHFFGFENKVRKSANVLLS